MASVELAAAGRVFRAASAGGVGFLIVAAAANGVVDLFAAVAVNGVVDVFAVVAAAGTVFGAEPGAADEGTAVPGTPFADLACAFCVVGAVGNVAAGGTAVAAAMQAAKAFSIVAASDDFFPLLDGLAAAAPFVLPASVACAAVWTALEARVEIRKGGSGRMGMTTGSVVRGNQLCSWTLAHNGHCRGRLGRRSLTISSSTRVAFGADGCKRQARQPVDRGGRGPLPR